MVALVLAAVGLYGVLAYAVARRTREMGVRMALGASPMDVRRLVVREGLTLTAVGVALGAAAAGVWGLRALLYGIHPLDPGTFAGAPLLLVAVAAVACLVPARRAARLDPAAALRSE